MDKRDKEQAIKEIRLKEIESFDRNNTSLGIKILVGFFAVLVFSYNFDFFKDYILFIFIGSLIILLFISNIQKQLNKYTSDCYESFSKAIKEDKILEYSLPHIGYWELLYYKLKY